MKVGGLTPTTRSMLGVSQPSSRDGVNAGRHQRCHAMIRGMFGSRAATCALRSYLAIVWTVTNASGGQIGIHQPATGYFSDRFIVAFLTSSR